MPSATRASAAKSAIKLDELRLSNHLACFQVIFPLSSVQEGSLSPMEFGQGDYSTLDSLYPEIVLQRPQTQTIHKIRYLQDFPCADTPYAHEYRPVDRNLQFEVKERRYTWTHYKKYSFKQGGCVSPSLIVRMRNKKLNINHILGGISRKVDFRESLGFLLKFLIALQRVEACQMHIHVH